MMKRVILTAGVVLSLFMAMVSCKKEEEDRGVVFELYGEGGELIEGVQSFGYGEKKEYKLVSKNVKRVRVEGPDKWGCEFYTGAKQAIITAPDTYDPDAAPGGTVTVTITSDYDESVSYKMEIAAVEGGISFDFADPVSGVQTFGYTQSIEYGITTDNVGGFDFVAPAGWEASADLSTNPQKIKISAPKTTEGIDISGRVKITPKSVRGNSGQPKEVEVELDNTLSTLLMETDIAVAGWGTDEVAGFEPINVSGAVIRSVPAGWSADIDLLTKELTITPPSDGSDPASYGNGVIMIELEDMVGVKHDFPVKVRLELESGIASAHDFVEFANAVTQGNAVPARYLVDGNPTLVLNVDLSTYDNATFVGNGTNKFAGTFDGGGRTVDIDMHIPETGGTFGLFHTLAGGAEIKNLNVNGSILCKVKETVNSTKTTFVAGAVAAYNEGANISGCVTNVDFTYSPSEWNRLGSGATAYYGSISGQVSGVAAFSNNISRGKVWMDVGALRSIGGQVGIIMIDGVTMDNCENTGELYLDFGDDAGYNADNTMYGGVVGSSQNADTKYIKCVNRGNITIDWHDAYTNTASARQVYGVGGIVAISYGTFEECENYGNLWAKDGSAVHTRRYGGILGAAWPGSRSNQIDLIMTDCVNHGEIRHTAMYAGGIAGGVTNAKYVHIKGCVNKGNIVNPLVVPEGGAAGRQPVMLGGLFGSYRGDLMEDCRNEGSISGQCYVQVGALVGEARLNWQGAATVNTIKNCTNTGSINVTTMKGSDAGGTAFLVVGGLVVTRDGTWRLEGCSNTGSITTQVEAAGRTKNIYYVRTGSGTGGSLTADTPTETEQAKTEYISETVMP